MAAVLVIGALGCAADAQGGEESDAGAAGARAQAGASSAPESRRAVLWECWCDAGGQTVQAEPVCRNRTEYAVQAATVECGRTRGACTCVCCATVDSCRTEEPEVPDGCGPGTFCGGDTPDPDIESKRCPL